MLTSNKANDTDWDSLEKFKSHVEYRLRKMMGGSEQRQETSVSSQNAEQQTAL